MTNSILTLIDTAIRAVATAVANSDLLVAYGRKRAPNEDHWAKAVPQYAEDIAFFAHERIKRRAFDTALSAGNRGLAKDILKGRA